MNPSHSRYIPKNALPIEEPGLGVVYVGPSSTHAGWFCVTAFREKAIRPDFCFRYRKESEVDAKVADFFDGIRAQRKMVAERRERNFAGHSFNVGDIITNSWGYDQTNVDWYRITRTTKNYVWLMPVASVLDAATGAMAGEAGLALDENLMPIDAEKGIETKHRAAGESVTMRHGCGSRYTGGTKYESWYA